MVKRWLAALCFLALNGAAFGAPRPSPAVVLDPATVALGEPVQLRITRTLRAGVAPAELDLSALAADFEITERTRGLDAAHETLALTLYPRHAGRIVLPTFGLPGRAVQLVVTDGSATLTRVQWRVSVDPPEPLTRQPVTFTLEACDDGSLLWQRPALPSAEGLLLRALNEAEIVTTRNGQRCTAHRWHWALLPTAAGALHLPLPVVQATKFGRPLRFPAPALDLTVQDAPQWLPTQAAVGPVELSAEPLPALLRVDQPQAWVLRVNGGYSAAGLEQLLALQLRQADARLGLERYAPQIEALPSTEAAPGFRVTLYLAPQTSGTLELPALQLPWFDPENGQLRQAALPAASIAVENPLHRLLLQGGMAVLVIALLSGVVWWLRGALRWRMTKRRLRLALAHAMAPDALRHTLLAFDAAPTDAAPTLQCWQARLAERWHAEGLAALVQAVDAACFAAESALPDEALQQQALTWAATLRPRSKVRRAR